VEQTVCKIETLQGNPARIGQIRGGLHHDGDVRSPGDVETEPAGTHAKVGAASLYQWVPQASRETVKSWVPASGAWEVIEGKEGTIE